MNDTISFFLNGERRDVNAPPPTQTLLQYLRLEENACGTKEGCAEGDCGACTVMIATPCDDGSIKREAVNACIKFMPSLHGSSVTTVEALSDDASSAHPVQQALIDHHGSQCGFCTPGFVMSLYTAYRNREPMARDEAGDILAGNLCRCTGYGPILKAAADIADLAKKTDQNVADRSERDALAALPSRSALHYKSDSGEAFIPSTTDELAITYNQNPDATLIAGATDVGLWVTKELRALPKVIFIDQIVDLKKIDETKDHISIGAGVSYTDAMNVIARSYPDFGELIRRIGSRQVRNAGTIGGNIANGSPIGDTPPALIALGAKIVLRKGTDRRTLDLENFFIDYGVQDIAAGEFVETIIVPNSGVDYLRCYKISKRFDQDISAVCGAFNIDIIDGHVATARIAFGGMAATPKRALNVEKALIGKPWVQSTIDQACLQFSHDFQPIDDMRASAGYRLKISQNLMQKYFLEKSGSTPLRIVGEERISI